MVHGSTEKRGRGNSSYQHGYGRYQNGYDIALTKAVTPGSQCSGHRIRGRGRLEHFSEVIINGGADAALAASLFHFGEFTIAQVKDYLESLRNTGEEIIGCRIRVIIEHT